MHPLEIRPQERLERSESITDPAQNFEERVPRLRQLPIGDELPEILLELLVVRGQALNFFGLRAVRRRECLDGLLALDEEGGENGLRLPHLRDVLGCALIGSGEVFDGLVNINHDAIGRFQLPRHASRDGLRDGVEGFDDIRAADLRELPRCLHDLDDL